MNKYVAITFLTMLAACVSAATAFPTKSCVAINKIINQSTADEEFFRSVMERLQNTIVNTGKFDVVDNTRLYEIAAELKKQEDELTDEEVDVSLRLATISIHGTILSMIVESNEILFHGQKYTKTVGTLELTIRFQDMKSGKISASKQVKITKSAMNQQNRVMKDTSKQRKFTRIVEPAKEIKNPNNGVVVTTIPAKTESIYFTPDEEKVYNETMQGAVDEVVEKLMEFTYPLYVISASKGRLYINLPEERSRQKMTAGSRFEIIQTGEEIIDPDTGEALGAEEERVMVVSLQTIRPKFAIAVPVENAENLPKVEDGMKKYRDELKAAKDKKAKSKIKPPFQVRLLEGKPADPRAASADEPQPSALDNRFRR